MVRFRSSNFYLAVAILSLLSLLLGVGGCGGGSKPGSPIFAGRITLTPSSTSTLVQGGVLGFTAAVQTASGTTISTPITFSSSDTSILNLSSNGVACAGHWDAAFTTCTPGNTGAVTVTATALGAFSVPTYVFVHPPIDSIAVTGVLLDGVPVQEPCLSQTQSMTLEAHAYSRGVDVTASVGPFVWSANNSTVVTLAPIANSAYTFPTNQVKATANVPGLTHIYATAGGVSSNSFQQPQYSNAQGQSSPVLDFFSTCPIRNIALEVTTAGSGQTSFNVAKGTSETIIATLTDVMGASSLPNTNGGIILTKVPLTWTSSQPAVVDAGTSCAQSCGLSIKSAGAGAITASCAPPSCNLGFPEVPTALSTTNLPACSQFFSFDCRLLLPAPVYASPAFVSSGSDIPLSPMGAISAVITGAPSATSVLAASTGCADEAPANCAASVFFPSTAGNSAGSANPLPVPPNSFLFDLAGDRLYMGSDFGAQSINPTSFGSGNNPATSLGTVVGRVLAASTNGSVAVFSDTRHTPNQVYIANTGTGGSTTALNIPAATGAAFSPDGLKTYILAGATGNSLYIYSSLQALQGPIALSGPGQAAAFSPNGAFALIAESSNGGRSANVTAFANCTNPTVSAIAPAASVNLPANPLLMKVLPNLHLDGRDSFGNTIPDGIHILVLDATGFNLITATLSSPAAGTVCPQGLQFISGDPLRAAQRLELGQGTIQPINFFASADATQLYVTASGNSTILVFDLISGSVTGGIELLNNATPISADISADAATIVIAGSDGLLHEVSTNLGGADLVQLSFPNLVNETNSFCTFTPTAGPCTLTTVQAKP